VRLEAASVLPRDLHPPNRTLWRNLPRPRPAASKRKLKSRRIGPESALKTLQTPSQTALEAGHVKKARKRAIFFARWPLHRRFPFRMIELQNNFEAVMFYGRPGQDWQPRIRRVHGSY